MNSPKKENLGIIDIGRVLSLYWLVSACTVDCDVNCGLALAVMVYDICMGATRLLGRALECGVVCARCHARSVIVAGFFGVLPPVTAFHRRHTPDRCLDSDGCITGHVTYIPHVSRFSGSSIRDAVP